MWSELSANGCRGILSAHSTLRTLDALWLCATVYAVTWCEAAWRSSKLQRRTAWPAAKAKSLYEPLRFPPGVGVSPFLWLMMRSGNTSPQPRHTPPPTPPPTSKTTTTSPTAPTSTSQDRTVGWNLGGILTIPRLPSYLGRRLYCAFRYKPLDLCYWKVVIEKSSLCSVTSLQTEASLYAQYCAT